MTIPRALAADPNHLMTHVRALEGERHPLTAPDSLAAAEAYVFEVLAELRLEVERQPFEYHRGSFNNVVARKPGTNPDRPRVLIGAHFDTVPGSPGADDNASGVAVMLECARLLAQEAFEATLEFVGFNLEEPQGSGYAIGSQCFAGAARRDGIEYAGCLILEMVGYTDAEPGSQEVPAMLLWKQVPAAGTFLAATGDGSSHELLRTFELCAARAIPELEVVTLRSPARGWLIHVTRLSDNASFWDQGYPALMITDTAFLRNPNYHSAGDLADTLDAEFMRQVTEAVAATARELAAPLG